MSYPPPSDPTRPLPAEEPASGQPWSTPSGDALSAQPPQFQPGHAPLPRSAPPDGYPRTEQFPAAPQSQPQYQDQYQQPQYQQPQYQQPQYQQPQYREQGYEQPGYGQPPGPPPGYQQPGYGQPGPRPKRNKAPLVAVLIAVTLLLCAGGVTTVVLAVNKATEKAKETINSVNVPDVPTVVPTDLPTELPTDLPSDVPGLPGLPGEGPEITVDYEVTGDGPVRIIYLEKDDGTPKQLSNQKLPWHITVKTNSPAVVSVVAVRIGLSEGTLSCVTKVNGEEVAQKTSTGSFNTAACTKIVQ